ncbi:MAG: DUF1802 family protein [Verrucomicrobiales bacterium]|nr:DUF1802 family protein [Verrucomicrobiales bacterium]
MNFGFKEWSLVCGAMGSGRQSLILRKGGIHEGRGGFSFQHAAFFLFPTEFHSQRERLRPGEVEALESAGELVVGTDGERQTVEIRHFVEVVETFRITDWQRAAALERFHVWSEEVVRERFDYTEETCLHAAVVRVFRLPEAWVFPWEKRYGGCRSWLELPEPPAGILDAKVAVVGDGEHDREVAEILQVAGRGA